MVIEASYTKVKITPPIGLRLGGYAHRLGKPARLVHDDLYARLLMLSSGDAELIIVQMDLLGLYSGDVSLIRRQVSKATGVNEGNVIVVTTHTHSAPETVIPMWPNTLPYSEEEKRLFNEWFNTVVAKVTDAAKTLNGTSRATVSAGVGRARGLCFNRSFKGGVVDEDLPVLMVKWGDGKVVLINYPCHPVCNTDLGFSADYPGVTYDVLLSSGVESMFLTGAAGDIDPVKKGRGYMSHLGYSLANAVTDIINSLKPMGNIIEFRGISIKLPARVVDRERAKVNYEVALKRVIDKGGLPSEPTESIWSDEDYLRLMYSDEEYEVAKLNEAVINSEIDVVRIGDLVMVTLPGEPFIETGLAIKEYARGLGFNFTMITGYTNDYIGYIPTTASFIMGTYEAKLARWSRVTDGAEMMIRESVFSALGELRH